MKFTVNVGLLGDSFPFPRAVAKKHLKLATKEHLSVLISVFSDLSGEISADKIAENLGITVSEAEDALLFWVQSGVLSSEEIKVASPTKKSAVINCAEMSRDDLLRRGMEDKNIQFLLREAQLKFGRNLKDNESKFLVSLYDDNGMKVSVILMLLQYAAQSGKCNVSFIRSAASRWIKSGVETVADAENMIKQSAKEELSWKTVMRVFGIERRKPSERELELSNRWINEWGISEDLLKAAYNVSIDAKAKLSFPYIAAVLESWHKKGIKSPDEIKIAEKSKKSEKNDYGGFDIDLFYKMANKD